MEKEEKVLSTEENQLLEAMGLGERQIPQDYVAYAGTELSSIPSKIVSREEVIEALKTVCDPEIMINIWDLGLVYKIDIEPNGNVKIDMTVTSPMCPVAGILPQQAADAVSRLDGCGLVEVKIVWEPAWTIENMSEEAKSMIELF